MNVVLSPLFWISFLATFFVVKALANAWLALPLPTAGRRTVVDEQTAAAESDVSLRPAA